MGLNSYQAHELVSWPYSDRVAASVWTIRCLGNPDCEGSDVAVAAILARREQLQREKSNAGGQIPPASGGNLGRLVGAKP